MSDHELPDAPSSARKIRFQDCDPFGHLNNARYLDYIINAREDHLAYFYDFDIYQRQRDAGTNWVVARHRIAYLAPAVMNQVVIIQTRLMSFTAGRLLMEGVMWDQAMQAPKAVLWTDFQHYSLLEKRALAHSAQTTKFLASIVQRDPALETVDFDARVAQVRG